MVKPMGLRSWLRIEPALLDRIYKATCTGVRIDGNCEVNPEMKCVWVAAYERAQQIRVFGAEMISAKSPVNQCLEDNSAWTNMLSGFDQIGPKGWADLPHNPVIEKQFIK